MITKNACTIWGKYIEHYIIGLMLRDGLDIYLPVIDNSGIDLVVKKPNGRFAEVQIKGRSKDAKYPAFFPDIKHEKPRPNFWFVFYAERFDAIFILSSREFFTLSGGVSRPPRRSGRQIRFDGVREGTPFIHQRYLKYIQKDFKRMWTDDV